YTIEGGKLPPAKRTVIFDNRFDIMTYHRVLAGLSVYRNQDLIGGQTTNKVFLYHTPLTTFNKPVTPLVDITDRVDFFPNYLDLSADTQLADMFKALLISLNSHGTDENKIQFSVGYRFALSESGLECLSPVVPLVMQSRQLFSKIDIERLAQKIENHLAKCQTDKAELVMDVTVYNPTGTSPIFHLHNLCLPAKPSPIHTKRYIPFDDPGQKLRWATDADAVNPLVAGISRHTDVLINTVTRRALTYDEPPRIKSWTGGLTWSDNTTVYYDPAPSVGRQVPIYADPLIGLYVCKLDEHSIVPDADLSNFNTCKDGKNTEGKIDKTEVDNYNGYFTQSNPATDLDNSIYVHEGWEAGFHLSVPNPSTVNGAAYNSGTGHQTYTNDLLIYNAETSGWPVKEGEDWIAAKYQKKGEPTNDDAIPCNYKTSAPTPKGSYQAGLRQYGIWRDTLSISPVSGKGAKAKLAFSPYAAKLDSQGDMHAEFVMEGDSPDRHQQLRMKLIQGSPFAQFTAAGIDGVRIAGIFNPQPGGVSWKYIGTPGGVYPASPGTIDKLKPVSGQGGASLEYLIIYQQVNIFHAEKIATLGTPRKNWVSFAIYWDPTVVTAEISESEESLNKQVLTLSFKSPQTDNYVAIAGLPSQMANHFNPETDTYDQAAMQVWAEKLGGYAFNFITDTTTTYKANQPKPGATPDKMTTTFTYDIKQVGPVIDPENTIMLLQPHHYFDPLNPKNTVLNETGLTPVFTGDQKQGEYQFWISRGTLKDKIGKSFSIDYLYPNLLPVMEMFPKDAAKKPTNPLPKSAAGTKAPDTLNLMEMAAAMIGNLWVSDFPDIHGTPQTEPAGTGLANTEKMQGTYNAGKLFFRAAKILPMLLDMVKSKHFDTLDVLLRVSGSTMFTAKTGKSLYAVGAHLEDDLPVYFTPGGTLKDFINHLFDAFAYYFGGALGTQVCRSLDVKQSSVLTGKSFYYSYYDDKNKHLFLYPASGAGGTWPSNVHLNQTYKCQDNETVKVFDGYGTVTGLNDHAYTYGYLIAAAALLGMVVNNPELEKLSYLTVNGTNQKEGPCLNYKDDIAGWKEKFTVLKPIIDQMVMNIAYDPAMKEKFLDVNDFTYQMRALAQADL
ncbi:MAG: hypothetical protein AAF629_36345, partial [Chloroflexota bacterium]